VRKFNDRDTLGPEEEKKRDDPKPDRDTTVGGDGGNYIQIEDSDYEQQNEIAAA
jgi:hypothetical protein